MVLRLAKYNVYRYIGCITDQSSWSGPFSLVVMNPEAVGSNPSRVTRLEVFIYRSISPPITLLMRLGTPFWQKPIKTEEGKLRTCKLFKQNQNFGLEPYIEIIHDRSMKRNICSFKISAHHLQIERGRYPGTNIDERLCNQCNVTEDETHFLFECKKKL